MKMNEDETGEGGESSHGGKAGEIRFRYKDAASIPPRDDVLSEQEINRLLTVLEGVHKERVDKQKLKRKEYQAAKEKKRHLVEQYRKERGYAASAGQSRFKKHPISEKAQFSGIDKQVIGIPTELEAETNSEMREKLENRYALRHMPKYTPKPRPLGM